MADDADEGPGATRARRRAGALAQLTRQQAKILELICEGKLNKQIAYDLSIAEATVKAHVTAIMRKLGVQSRTQAVLIAREANFREALHDRLTPGTLTGSVRQDAGRTVGMRRPPTPPSTAAAEAAASA